MKLQRPQLRRARIEIVPMIDTIFFLLVFFMFTTLSMVKMHGMGLSMPKDAASGGKPPPRLTLAVSPAGQYFLNAKALAPADLPAALQADVAAHPDTVVVVNVAPNQQTQTLISVMDVVHEILTRAGSNAPILVATERVAPPTRAKHGQEKARAAQ
jgi:biopolymer transport protein ExbD